MTIPDVNEPEGGRPSANALLNIEELAQRKTVLRSYPFKLFIEPTQRCDLDCTICSKKRHKSLVDMPPGLFREIERELFPSVSEVNFFIGGEPTLSGNFHEMIRTSSKYGFLPKIFTNAINTKEETIRLLVELGFFVNISLEAATPALYESIRVGAKFEQLERTVGKYLHYREKIKNPRFHLRLACTCSPFNIDDVPNVMRLAKRFGIDDVFFNNCDKNVFERQFNLATVAEKAYRILMEAKAYADENKIRFSCQKRIGHLEIGVAHNWNDFTLPIDRYAPRYLEKYNPYNGKCPHPWIQTLIRTDGTVMACCQGYVKMGKYLGGDFRGIWNNKRYQALRSRSSYTHCGMSPGRWYCNLTRTSIWES